MTPQHHQIQNRGYGGYLSQILGRSLANAWGVDSCPARRELCKRNVTVFWCCIQDTHRCNVRVEERSRISKGKALTGVNRVDSLGGDWCMVLTCWVTRSRSRICCSFRVDPCNTELRKHQISWSNFKFSDINCWIHVFFWIVYVGEIVAIESTVPISGNVPANESIPTYQILVAEGRMNGRV